MSKESRGGCCSLVGVSSLNAGDSASVGHVGRCSVLRQRRNKHQCVSITDVSDRSHLCAQDPGDQTESLHLSADHSINIILQF